MSLLPRTHEGEVYRPTTTKDQYNAESEVWSATPVADGVKANLQPRRADLESQGFGRLLEGQWRGFFPADVDLTEGDGFLVTTVLQGGHTGPERFRVTGLGPQGSTWDLEVDLQVSQASFG